VLENYGGLPGDMLYFNILVQNVMGERYCALTACSWDRPEFAISSNAFWLGVLYRRQPRGGRLLEGAAQGVAVRYSRSPAFSSRPPTPVARRDGPPRMRGRKSTPLGVQHRTCLPRYFAVVFPPLLIVAAAIETGLSSSGCEGALRSSLE